MADQAIRDGGVVSAGAIDAGWLCVFASRSKNRALGNDQENSGATFNCNNLFNGLRTQDPPIFGLLCVEWQKSAIETGCADLVPADQYVTQRSNRLPGDFSHRLNGSAVLRSRRDIA